MNKPSLNFVFFLALLGALSGCARVAANYPRIEPTAVTRNPFADSPWQCTQKGVSFHIGDRIDTAAIRTRQASVFEPMRQAMGASAFEAMQADSRRTYPWSMHINEDRSHDYYRGSIVVADTTGFLLGEGVLIFCVATEGDTLSIRDRGILVRDAADQRNWPFSANGMINSRATFKKTSPRHPYFITVRMPPGGTICGVSLDSTRIKFFTE